jgi:hypothetical protein
LIDLQKKDVPFTTLDSWKEDKEGRTAKILKLTSLSRNINLQVQEAE